MILDVSVTEYRHHLSPYELGLVRDKFTQAVLKRSYAPQWFTHYSRWIWPADLNAGRGFQWYVDKYAEMVIDDPWHDIELFYSQFSGVSGMPPGGVGPLAYPTRYPLMNTSALASAGEALAGWFCETHYNWALISRPRLATPDLIFRDPVAARWALVEVKSTGSGRDTQARLIDDMIKLLQVLAISKHLRPRPYNAVLIVVAVSGSTNVSLTSLLLEE